MRERSRVASAFFATYHVASAIQFIPKPSLPEPSAGMSGEIHCKSFEATGSPRTRRRRLFLFTSYHPRPAILLFGRTTRALDHHSESFVNQNFPTSDSTAIVGGLNRSE